MYFLYSIPLDRNYTYLINHLLINIWVVSLSFGIINHAVINILVDKLVKRLSHYLWYRDLWYEDLRIIVTITVLKWLKRCVKIKFQISTQNIFDIEYDWDWAKVWRNPYWINSWKSESPPFLTISILWAIKSKNMHSSVVLKS